MAEIVELRPNGRFTRRERDEILAASYALSARGRCEGVDFPRTDQNEEYASVRINSDRALILGRNERGFYLTEDGAYALIESPSLATVLERLAVL
jgi:hypothetical protein